MSRCSVLPYENGKVPRDALRSIGEGSHRLYGPAASAYMTMRDAALRDGVKISVTDSYRSLDGQIACRAAKGNLCATPGRSNHGCGLAIDVPGEAARKWIQTNGSRYGWIWPAWARSPEAGGSKYEPWHFEYKTDGSAVGSGVDQALIEGGFQPSNPLIPDQVEELAHVIGVLADPQVWIRVGWTVGGGTVILVGAYFLAREFGAPSIANALPVGKVIKAVGA